MLKELHLKNFRSFVNFKVSFGNGAYLVGPNNAGKSTLLTAIRVADTLVRYAHRRKPDKLVTDRDVRLSGYPIGLREFPALRDSLRFEFGSAETRLELIWKSGAKLTAVWPEENSDDDGSEESFFYLTAPDGSIVKTVSQAKSLFPQLGLVPLLTPTEHTEKLLADDYVRQNISGRLSSRHFRNQLRVLNEADALQPFLDWAEPWLDGITFDSLALDYTDDGPIVHVFFFEAHSRVPKEVVWAGDGIQVWLQILYHVFRVRDFETIVLDEPEVYLHPDLQRRLVRLLDSTERQIVIATHSSEMIAESDGRLTTLVDKSRRRAIRSRSDSDYEMLSTTLGTAFNLRLAKALRSRVAVFVEGHDMSVLRILSKTLGLAALASERGVTVMPLNGYSNWGQVEPFKWLCEKILPNALTTFVILDRDYRPESTRIAVMNDFELAGVRGHVWGRKELESYLINSAVIARLSGASEGSVVAWLDEITAAMENEVFGRMLFETQQSDGSARNHSVSITTTFKPIFDARWLDAANRLHICPPKQIIAHLNDKLQSEGKKSISIAALARAHRISEIPEELAHVLREIEASI
ncbi:ATP-dependent endonuclease [Cryobacterium sp. M15]|uniref:ATP-dependent nuclease n=1 Tax=Cryobacterium sp. M15 TaxID=2048291 RepID=UPI0013049E6C|nr:AAA family ATPase [Cryobacterium sp. M15]